MFARGRAPPCHPLTPLSLFLAGGGQKPNTPRRHPPAKNFAWGGQQGEVSTISPVSFFIQPCFLPSPWLAPARAGPGGARPFPAFFFSSPPPLHSAPTTPPPTPHSWVSGDGRDPGGAKQGASAQGAVCSLGRCPQTLPFARPKCPSAVRVARRDSSRPCPPKAISGEAGSPSPPLTGGLPCSGGGGGVEGAPWRGARSAGAPRRASPAPGVPRNADSTSAPPRNHPGTTHQKGHLAPGHMGRTLGAGGRRRRRRRRAEKNAQRTKTTVILQTFGRKHNHSSCRAPASPGARGKGNPIQRGPPAHPPQSKCSIRSCEHSTYSHHVLPAPTSILTRHSPAYTALVCPRHIWPELRSHTRYSGAHSAVAR